MKFLLKFFSLIITLGFVLQPLHVAAETEENEKNETEYFEATFSNFSKAYWRFNKFDFDDRLAVDNFMQINECNLYKEYYHNEFEWSTIRDATQKFLEENKKKFPRNFQFVQSVSLGEYDFERKGFRIVDEHKYDGVKRFEMPSDMLLKDVCDVRGPIEKYPKAIGLELTRPLLFDFFEIEEGLAKEILSEKMEDFDKLKTYSKTRKEFLRSRQVYMRMKVKFFAYKPEDLFTKHNYYIANMLGILEEIEVFSDSNLTQLIYRKDFRRKKTPRKKKF